jgi:hypothetical protein
MATTAIRVALAQIDIESGQVRENVYKAHSSSQMQRNSEQISRINTSLEHVIGQEYQTA